MGANKFFKIPTCFLRAILRRRCCQIEAPEKPTYVTVLNPRSSHLGALTARSETLALLIGQQGADLLQCVAFDRLSFVNRSVAVSESAPRSRSISACRRSSMILTWACWSALKCNRAGQMIQLVRDAPRLVHSLRRPRLWLRLGRGAAAGTLGPRHGAHDAKDQRHQRNSGRAKANSSREKALRRENHGTSRWVGVGGLSRHGPIAIGNQPAGRTGPAKRTK